jgi:uncharacterized YccA/Bax inhibitor family protein
MHEEWRDQMAFNFSSPVAKPELFEAGSVGGSWGEDLAKRSAMTVSGAINASFTLLSICVMAAALTWYFAKSNSLVMIGCAAGGAIVGLILSVVMMFKPRFSPFLAPVHAIAEGALVGGASLMYATYMVGGKVAAFTGTNLILSASIGTFLILTTMLGLYKARIINATAKFKAVMMVGGITIALFSIASLVMTLFGVKPVWLTGGPIAIAIAAAILLYSAFVLILDFDMIETGAASGAPKYMEWYSGFMLLSTLVWIYLNLLRLLSLLNRRD